MPKGNGNGIPAVAVSELPLLTLPSRHPCHECGACCRYVAVEIDAPSAFKDYDHIHWYLSHRSVSIYIDWNGDWFIEFETVCEHLSERATCGIYEDRPQICSDFSWNECEKTTQERAWKYRFLTQEQFESWHLEKRPKSYARYAKARRMMKSRRQRAAAAGRPVAESAAEPR